MEFSEKGTMDPMNGHFSPINGLGSVNGIQFSLCGTPMNLIFAHRGMFPPRIFYPFWPPHGRKFRFGLFDRRANKI